MENASKALLIAGGVLIAIAALTVGIYLRAKLGNVSESYVDELDLIEIQKYNSYFESFIGRDDITAQEIITVINIAQEKQFGTEVYISTGRRRTKYTEKNDDEKNVFLKEHINCMDSDGSIKNIYTLDSNFFPIKYYENGIIKEITFTKISEK